jgi:hypothetical protein
MNDQVSITLSRAEWIYINKCLSEQPYRYSAITIDRINKELAATPPPPAPPADPKGKKPKKQTKSKGKRK